MQASGRPAISQEELLAIVSPTLSLPCQDETHDRGGLSGQIHSILLSAYIAQLKLLKTAIQNSKIEMPSSAELAFAEMHQLFCFVEKVMRDFEGSGKALFPISARSGVIILQYGHAQHTITLNAIEQEISISALQNYIQIYTERNQREGGSSVDVAETLSDLSCYLKNRMQELARLSEQLHKGPLHSRDENRPESTGSTIYNTRPFFFREIAANPGLPPLSPQRRERDWVSSAAALASNLESARPWVIRGSNGNIVLPNPRLVHPVDFPQAAAQAQASTSTANKNSNSGFK